MNIDLAKKIIDKFKELSLGASDPTHLEIEIPMGLFYYAESETNGNEEYLEGKQIHIKFTGYDDRDTRYLYIKIAENSDIDIFLSKSQNKNNSYEIYLNVEMKYQIARDMLLTFIKGSSPHSVNLITK